MHEQRRVNREEPGNRAVLTLIQGTLTQLATHDRAFYDILYSHFPMGRQTRPLDALRDQQIRRQSLSTGGLLQEDVIDDHIFDHLLIPWITCKGESPHPHLPIECRSCLHNGSAHYLSVYGYLRVATCDTIVVFNTPNIF
jgi:hypothetical protein